MDAGWSYDMLAILTSMKKSFDHENSNQGI